MIKLKKLFKEQLKQIDSKEEAEIIYGILDRLNSKLDRYDSPLGNMADAVEEFFSLTAKSKMKSLINDIFDNYEEYNAADKAAINAALHEIHDVAHNSVNAKLRMKVK